MSLRLQIRNQNGMRFFVFALVIASSWSALANEESATPLPTPSSAVDVGQHVFNDGHAFQTDFKLIAEFPANPALTHYAATFDKSWTGCAWMDWNHFLDGTQNPPATIHQTGHIWLKPQAKRFIMLSVRYVSSDKCVRLAPDRRHRWT